MNNFAITSAGIGEALQRSASALFTAGNTIDESVALVTAANSVIQNPEQVGTALKTLSLRLRGAKTELEEAGEDVEGMAENTSQLQAKLKALTHGKVDIMLDANTFKSTTQILREMSTAWEEMNDIERASALELMGGKRQANILSSVITNFETVEEVIETSMNSSGSAIAENEKWLDSIEGKTYQFTNALQTMWNNMLDSEMIKGFIDFGTDAIQFFDTGAGKVVAFVAALKLMAKFKGFSIGGIAKGLSDTIQNITKAQQTLQALSAVSPVTGALPTESINAYAQAVAGLTAKQQANLLASQNLTKQDIQRVLQTNQCTEAEIREAMAHVHTKTTKDQEATASQALFVAKTQEMAATYRNNAATLQGAAADEALTAATILETAASKNASQADLLEMINQSNLTAATKQQIIAELGLTGAKKAGEAANYGLLASIQALYASNPIGWILGIISGVVMLISWLSNLEDGTQKIIDKAKEAESAISSLNEEFKSDAKTVTECAERFAELAQGVDMLTGKNLSLTTDDYEEFLDLSNKLADIFPTLSRNYDENGNAIVQLSGDTNTMVGSLKSLLDIQRQITNQNIAENLPDLYAGVKAKSDGFSEELKELEAKKTEYENELKYLQDDISGFLNNLLNNGSVVVSADDKFAQERGQILKQLGIKYSTFVKKGFGGITQGYTYKLGLTMSDEDIKKAKANIASGISELAGAYSNEIDNLNTQIQNLINENNANWKSLLASITSWLSTESSYQILNDKMQSTIQTIINNLDYTSLNFKSWEDAQKWIKDNIIKTLGNAKNKDEIQDALNNLLTVDVNKTSYKVYEGLKTALLEAIKTLPKETQDAMKKAFGLDGNSEYDKYLERAKALLQDSFDDKAKELSLSDLKIVGQLDIPPGTLLSWDELKQKIAKVKNAAVNVISSKAYSELSESVENYNDILAKTAEYAVDNTQVTQEYKDSLIDLGISQEELNKCFDKSNPLIVKNAKALNKLVKEANKNVAANVKLAKSNARLDYYQLVQQLNDTLDGTKKLDDATRDSIQSTLEQIDAVQKALYQYQLLEDTLLGVNNAFKEFNEAKEIDELNTYGDSYVEMVQTMYDGLFKTGQVGTEQFWAAVEHLVPDEVYQGLKEDSDRMKAIYDYYNKKILPSLHLEDDQFSMDYASIENFVKKALDAKVFKGDRKDFDLVEGMNLEKAAKLMGMTTTQAYAFFAELDKYNTSSTEPSFLAQLDDSLEGQITNISNKIEDLNKQKLALLEDGGYEKNKDKIQEIDKQIQNAEKDLDSLGQQAYTTWQKYTENEAALAALNEISDKSQKISDVWPEELITNLGLNGDMTVEEAYNRLLAKQLELEKPTVLTAQLAIENIDDQIAALKAKLEKSEQDPTVLGVEADADQTTIDAAKQKIQEQIQALEEDKVVLATTFGIELSEEEKKDLEDELDAIEKFTINDKEFTVRANGTSEVMKLLEAINKYSNDVTKTVTTVYKTVGTPNEKQYSGWTHTSGGGRYTMADGTAHVDGTAYKNGSWGAPKTETALVGELGPEMLVRNGRWTTIGDNGAEFTQVKKGDIIFNHKQTEDLLSKGYVTGRGKLHGGAFASGTAYSGLWRPTSPNTEQSNKPGKDFSDSGNRLFNAADSLSSAADSISSSASDAADEFREVFDWIEVRLEEINDDINLRSAQLENKVGHTAQNKTVDKIIDLNQKLYDNLIAGSNKYYAYANKLLSKVPAEYRKAAQDGTIAIETFVGEADEKTLGAIQEYREWVQKGDEAAQQAEETLTEISNLAKQAIDNIADDYDNKTSVRDSNIEQLEAQNALLETDKGSESEAIYKEMIKQNNKNISTLEQQRDKMQAELNKRVESGEIKKYSQDWYDAVNDIAAVDTAIIEAKTDTENWQDAINELHWEHFDNLMSQYESVSEEADNLIDILGNKDLVDDSGNWTDEGIASLGLYAQQMENAEMQAKQYEEEIKYLNKNWQKLGYTEEEYLEKLDELKDGQYDAVKAYNDTKDAIVDLNKERIDAIKEGIEEEIEAYEELINKKKEELDAEKDLHDFQKSVMDQQKDIADIQRQLAALSGDNSASARAKRAQLEAELAKAQAELNETYYERSISNQQEALDKELENFQEEKNKEMEALDEYLENTEQVVSDSMGVVQANVDGISKTIGKTANEYGLTINDALTEPWKDGVGAVSEYTEQFGDSVSATSDALKELELENLANQLETELSGNDAVDTVQENFERYQEAEYQEPKKEEPKDDKPKKEEKAIKVGGKINAGNAKIYDYAGASAENQYYSKNPIYQVLAIDGNWVQVRHTSKKSGVTGWFKKSDVKAYAKGSSGIDEDQWALIDELGEELVLRAQNGRLTYLEKGSGVVPADLTSNLMEWGKLDPSIMLDQNRPQVAVHPEVHNTQIQIDNSIAELVHIDKCDQSTLPDIEKIINNALEKHTQRLNQSLRKFTR